MGRTDPRPPVRPLTAAEYMAKMYREIEERYPRLYTKAGTCQICGGQFTPKHAPWGVVDQLVDGEVLTLCLDCRQAVSGGQW